MSKRSKIQQLKVSCPTEPPRPAMQNIKCLLVGDNQVGKTCFVSTYIKNRFQKEYQPTDLENHTTQIAIDKQERYRVLITDTSGTSNNQLRKPCYPHTDIVLIFFSITPFTSFENAKNKWAEEVKFNSPATPFCLVGTPTDQRGNDELDQKSLITTEVAEHAAKLMGAADYVECSSVTRDGLQRALYRAVRTAAVCRKEQEPKKKKKKSACAIL
eukprot:TRINITY_DN11417_c0_g1_i1.p1 TRINITY_DN11417_c0_g1~~TRINITY_DN11417_c0_g1_i1.p1  ORF type:complete len:214 (-),score=28.37 TRINITY_DN11417_c0_g1_i1:3-644(-)